MDKIKINNIGPIGHAEFDINKVNVFIGPQSCGKSTIAKLVSFCQWLEKYVLINQGTDSINSAFFKSQLLTFHGFYKYFKEDSYIEYESDTILFKYHTIESYRIELKEGFRKGAMNKVAYIPSERNILSMPNISTLPMEDNYVRGFIFDWLNMRNKYDSANSYSILNLGAKYYYDKSKGDIISLDDGNELPLSEVSSGLQALIPMLVYIDYVTRWIYENDADISYNKYTSLQRALLNNVLKDKKVDFSLDDALQNPEIREGLNSLLNTMSHLSKLSNGYKNTVTALIERIGKPHSTKLTIEEGEMNIFPSTQYELVKAIIMSMNFKRGDTLLLTTHSPYMMTSLNNLIQAGNSIKESPTKLNTIEAVIPKACWLDYADVNAWLVDNGTITSIKDDEYRLISSEALDIASEEISEDFSQLM